MNVIRVGFKLDTRGNQLALGHWCNHYMGDIPYTHMKITGNKCGSCNGSGKITQVTGCTHGYERDHYICTHGNDLPGLLHDK